MDEQHHRRGILAVFLLVFVLIWGAAGCKSKEAEAVTGSGSCDVGLALDSTDPLDAAKAIGLCSGVLSAIWVDANGGALTLDATFHLGHGILPNFGPNVQRRAGGSLLALSSGTARRPTDPGYVESVQIVGTVTGFDKGYSSTLPAGYPMPTPGCSATPSVARDGIALEVVLDVPSSATGFAVDVNYHTTDYSLSVCSDYTDQFALMNMTDASLAGSSYNVAMDSLGNPISAASTGSMLACVSNAGLYVPYTCPLGSGLLVGTGFDGYGASEWLTVTGTAASNPTSLRFMIWDVGDGLADSTVLIDNFRWQ